MNRITAPVFAALAVSLPALLDSAVKGTALLGFVAVLALLMRKASAATRHLAWLVGIAGLLFLPLLSAALPGWRVLPEWASVPIGPRTTESTPPGPTASLQPPSQTSAGDASSRLAESSPRPAIEAPAPPIRGTQIQFPARPDRANATQWLAAIWLAGSSLVLMRVGIGALLLRSVNRRATLVTEGPLRDALESACSELHLRRRVQLLLDERRIVPLVWGIFRTRLVLPGESSGWDDSRLRAVLLHELAHVKRRDLLAMLMTHFACAIHWFNPLVWLAAWRLHVERERACDDLVLSAGVKASDYAEHLLHVATRLETTSPAGALAMARPSRLEGRLLAVLNQRLRRGGVPRSIVLVALALGLAVVIPMAMLRAQEKAATPRERRGTGSVDVMQRVVAEAPPVGSEIPAAPPEGTLQHTSKAGRWRLGGGVVMDVSQEVYHGADVLSSGVLWWPAQEGRPALRHEFSLAADAFGNREPWKMVWLANGTTLYIAMGESRFMGKDRDKKHTIARVRQLEFSNPAAIVETHWSSAGPVPKFVSAALAADFDIPAEDTGKEVQSYSATARLERTWVITGITRNTAGKRLPNVPIALRLENEAHPFEQIRSDSEGRFWTSVRPPFTALTAGCTINVKANRINGIEPPADFQEATITLTAAEIARHVRASTERGSTAVFTGTLKTPTGKPFPHALIAILPDNESITGFTTRTDAKGKFHLAGAPANVGVAILAEAPRHKNRGSVNAGSFLADHVCAAKLTLAPGRGWEWDLVFNWSTPEEIEKDASPDGASGNATTAEAALVNAVQAAPAPQNAVASFPKPVNPQGKLAITRGRLLDSEGKPIPKRVLWIVGTRDGERVSYQDGPTRPDGTFEFTDMPVGVPWQVCIPKENGPEGFLSDPITLPDEKDRELEVRFDGRSVAAKLLEPAGAHNSANPSPASVSKPDAFAAAFEVDKQINELMVEVAELRKAEAEFRTEPARYGERLTKLEQRIREMEARLPGQPSAGSDERKGKDRARVAAPEPAASVPKTAPERLDRAQRDLQGLVGRLVESLRERGEPDTGPSVEKPGATRGTEDAQALQLSESSAKQADRAERKLESPSADPAAPIPPNPDKVEKKVPVLGDIPILGRLFRTDGEKDVLEVNADGTLLINATPVSHEVLAEKLAALTKAHPDHAIVVRAEENVPYSNVTRALEICRAAGIRIESVSTTSELEKQIDGLMKDLARLSKGEPELLAQPERYRQLLAELEIGIRDFRRRFPKAAAPEQEKLDQAERELQRLIELHRQPAVSTGALDQVKRQAALEGLLASGLGSDHPRVKALRAQIAVHEKKVPETPPAKEVDVTQEIARIRVRNAERDLERLTDLRKQRAVSEAEYERAVAELDLRKAELANDAAMVARIRLAQAEKQLERIEALERQKLVSTEELDRARLEVEVRKAEMAGDRAAQAMARVRHAEATLERSSQLLAQNLISAADHDAHRYDLEIARAALRQATSEKGKAAPREPSAEILQLLDEELRLAEQKLAIVKQEQAVGAGTALPVLRMQAEVVALQRAKAAHEGKPAEVERLFDEQIQLLQELHRAVSGNQDDGTRLKTAIDIQREILALKRERATGLSSAAGRGR